jgi:endonuclease III
MSQMSKQDLAEAVLERHGQSFAEEIGIDVSNGSPSPLFRLLCASILMSARISSEIAVRAAQNLSRSGWRTAAKLADSTWEQRVEQLNDAGYTRYQERTATMLGDTADFLLERYGGDLRRLRDEADGDPGRERELLHEIKGLGDVGIDIFFREAQVVWDELFPFAGDRALDAAQKLGLRRDPDALVDLVGRRRFPQLVAGLVRVGLEDGYADVRDAARAA